MTIRSPLMSVMHKACMMASKRMMRDFGEVQNLQVTRKGLADFVSRTDLDAEASLHSALSKARPDWGFVMEEGGIIAGTSSDSPQWIIDPLDGTTNFLHGIPHFAISIAVREAGQITTGCIYDPFRHDFYRAELGKGAYLNDRRIRVSGRASLSDCLFATGIPFLGRGTAETDQLFLAELHSVMSSSAGVRRFGAAALDLAYVATGRYDGFWERGLKIWDIAAGAILVREAGGFISDFSAREADLEAGDIIAATATIHPLLMKKLDEAKK